MHEIYETIQHLHEMVNRDFYGNDRRNNLHT